MTRATVRDVAESLQSRIDEVVELMVAEFERRIPAYPQLLERNGDDVRLVARTAASMFLLLVRDGRDPSLEEMDLLRKAAEARAAAGVPLEALMEAYSIGREVAFGVALKEATRRDVDEEEINKVTLLLTRFMEKATLTVTQAYLERVSSAYEAEQRQLEALLDLSKAINRSLELVDVVGVGLERTLRSLRVEWAGLWLVDDDRALLRLYQQQKDPDWVEARGVTEDLVEAPIEDSALGRLARSGEDLVLSGGDLPARAIEAGCRMVRIVPLIHRSRPLGLLGVASRSREQLPEPEVKFLHGVAEQMAVAVNQIQEHMREARTDFLTGLANRVEFDHFLRREIKVAERFGEQLSLAMLDLDGLKEINDERGHQAGDEALRNVGQALRSSVRAVDLAARIGGDEFALVMPQADSADARHVIDRFLQRVEDKIGVSIGIVEWRKGQTFEQLCAAADGELYEMKRERQGR